MGDRMLRQYDGCPLGRTTRMVLVVLLKACPALAAHLDGSGVKVAMDNYFTSPVLALCLAEHCLWVVGTVRKNRTGLCGVAQFWNDNGMSVKARGDMVFGRFEGLSVVRWVDSTDLHLLSTVHIFESDFQRKPYQ